jgi:hypothetical protein
MSSEPKIITEVNKVGRQYDRLTWGFTKVFNEPDLRGSLKINYHIIIRTNPVECEAVGNPCYRFIPIVSFSWTSYMPPIPASCSVERLEGCPIPQRIPEKLNKFTAFYKLGYGKNIGLTLTSDSDNVAGTVAKNLGIQNILTSETRFRATTDGEEGDYDNIHTAYVNQGVSIPGCRETSFDCLHMHWRWSNALFGVVDPHIDTIHDVDLGPGAGRGDPYFCYCQTIDIAIVKDHSDKAYEAFPVDSTRLVDGEPIASARGSKMGVDGPSAPGVFLSASYHPVVWYIASEENTNEAEFFRHGMFVLDRS